MALDDFARVINVNLIGSFNLMRLADIVIVYVKTTPNAGSRGISLLVLERGTEGFERSRNLDKIVLHANDIAELFFKDAGVPVENLLGEEGDGFKYLMHDLAQEHLSIAVGSVSPNST